jgi:hypothetical protein
MNINKRFFLLLAALAGAAVGAVAASRTHVRHHRNARDLEHKEDLKSWENEGGNLAPAAVSPAQL